jgi:hypothetical protein
MNALEKPLPGRIVGYQRKNWFEKPKSVSEYTFGVGYCLQSSAFLLSLSDKLYLGQPFLNNL